MRTTFLTLLTLALTLAALAASLGVLQPVDEGSRDAGFLAYRTRLLEAVKKKDVAALKAAVSPKILYTFGEGPPGWEGFRKFFELDEPGSELWPALSKALRHGGGWREGTFSAPYVYSHWPESIDAYTHGAILGKNVKVRAEATPEARVIGELSYNIVPIVDRGPEFVKIKLPEGGTGYVPDELFESPIGYRALFEKQGGRWLMTVFIAGD